jgi:hypothetical protein
MAKLSALRTDCLQPQEISLVFNCVSPESTPGPRNGRKELVNEKSHIGNRICDLTAYSEVPQQTAVPRNPVNLTGDTEVKSESINTVIDSTEYNPSSQTLKNS